jgi:hypothetical protein
MSGVRWSSGVSEPEDRVVHLGRRKGDQFSGYDHGGGKVSGGDSLSSKSTGLENQLFKLSLIGPDWGDLFCQGVQSR